MTSIAFDKATTFPFRELGALKKKLAEQGMTLNYVFKPDSKYLVSSEKASRKIKLAKEWGIPVISPQDLREMVGLAHPANAHPSPKEAVKPAVVSQVSKSSTVPIDRARTFEHFTHEPFERSTIIRYDVFASTASSSNHSNRALELHKEEGSGARYAGNFHKLRPSLPPHKDCCLVQQCGLQCLGDT